ASVKILANNLRAAGGDKSKASAMYFDGPNAKQFGPGAYQYVQKVANNYNALEQSPVASSSQPSQTPALDALIQKAQAQVNTPQQSGASDQVATPALDALVNNAQAQLAQQSQAQAKQGGIGANLKAGLEDVLIGPGEALDKALNGTDVGTWMQRHNMLATPAQDAATYQQDTSNLGATLPDQLARGAGQIIGTAPLLVGGEGVLNAGADAIKAGLTGSAGEGIGNAAQAAARFLTGNAGKGIVGKTLSLVAQGAGQTAAFDALTGRPVTPAGVVVGAVANPLLAGAGSLAVGKVGDIANTFTPKSTQAARTVAGALQMDNASVPELQTIGRNGNAVVDVGGPNTQMLAQSIAQKPGEGSAILNSALESRVQNAPQAVRSAVQGALGSTGDIYDLDASVAAQQKAAASPLYERAYSVGPVWNDKLASLLQRPSVAAAWRKAQNIAGDEGIDLPQVFNTDESGKITGVETTPDMQTWDYIKRGLDDVVQAHRNQLTGKIDTDAARSANNVKNELVSALDDANPAYAEARAAYAGPAKVRDAIQMGRKVFSQDSEVTQSQIAKMSPSEKSAFQAGVARAVLDKLPDPEQTGKNAVSKLLNTPQFSSKLSVAFDNPQQFQQFTELLNDIGNQAASRNTVLKGSQTAARLAAQGHDWSGVARRALFNALAGHHIGAAAELGAGVMRQSAAEGDPALDAEIAKLLTNQDQGQVAAQLRKAVPSRTRRALGALTGGAGEATRLYALPALLQPAGSAQ
ncbi:MAG: hypothetical protein KGH75_11900, partial [Rhodospirillales bacterium]|nr:hypothetical protein [Rhodospirillales bacterium]